MRIVRDVPRAWAAPWLVLAACEFGALGQAGTAGLSSSGDQGTGSMTDAIATSTASTAAETTMTGEGTSSGGADPTEGSASDEGDGTSTGEPPPPPSGPFGDPVPVTILNSPADDDDPALSPDGLTLYFETNRETGTGDIFVSRRESLDADWGAPERVPGINDPNANDGTPAPTLDGLGLFFASDRPGTIGGDDVYVSLWQEMRRQWGPPTRVDALSSPWADLAPHPAPGGGLHLCSDRVGSGSGSLDVYFTPSADPMAQTYEPLEPVSELNSANNDCMATLRPDGLELVFDTDRGPPAGTFDLWSATRERADADLGEPFVMATVNSSADDRDPWISPDGHELYFATNREAGNFDIWVATR